METNVMTVEQLQQALANAQKSTVAGTELQIENGWDKIPETGLQFKGLPQMQYTKDDLTEQEVKRTAKNKLPYLSFTKLGKKFDAMLGTFKRYLPADALQRNVLPLSFIIYTDETGAISDITF